MAEQTLIDKIGSSTFWAIMVSIGLASLVLLGVWSYHNDSILGLALVIIFGLMTITGIIFSGFEVFSESSWGDSVTSFLAGFSIYMLITSSFRNGAYSLLSITPNNLLSSVIGEMPRYLSFIMNAILIPISEEIFWMFGVNFLSFSILRNIAKKQKWLDNFWLQLTITSLISGISFATFHVGKSSPVFILAAILFRATMAYLVFGDQKFDIIPYFTITTAFALGAHQGNNWGNFGWMSGWEIVNSNFWSWGWIIYLLGLSFIIGTINNISQKIFLGDTKQKTAGIVMGSFFLVILAIIIIL